MMTSKLLCVSLIALVVTGCSSPSITLHPVMAAHDRSKIDMVPVAKGTTLPGGEFPDISTPTSGYWVSDGYLAEMFRAAVDSTSTAR